MGMVTALFFIRHSTIVLALHIHDTRIHHCVTEDRNKSHYGLLCESRKEHKSAGMILELFKQ